MNIKVTITLFSILHLIDWYLKNFLYANFLSRRVNSSINEGVRKVYKRIREERIPSVKHPLRRSHFLSEHPVPV